MNDARHTPDDLDALLLSNVESDGKGLREALRGQVTTAFVRRHRRRRARRALSMAACYALGIVTIYAWQQVSASPADRVDATAVKTVETPRREKIAAERPTVAPVASQDIKAGRNVPSAPVVAKHAKKSRFDALRELGDHHLLADRNPEQAIRCYRVALRYATAEEFTAASREGTWLLRAICLDSNQEKDHAPEKS